MQTKLNRLLNSSKILGGLFLALTLQAGFVYAEEAQTAPSTEAKKKEPLVIALTAQKIMKDANGKEVFRSADKVNPGDVLEYRASYANVSKAELKDVVATLPIPVGMGYVDKTATPVTATATVDGVKFEALPLKRMVKNKEGKEEVKLVPVSEYRALRWTIGKLDVGKKVVVSARVQVSELPKAPEGTADQSKK